MSAGTPGDGGGTAGAPRAPSSVRITGGGDEARAGRHRAGAVEGTGWSRLRGGGGPQPLSRPPRPCRQQKAAETEEGTVQIQEGERGPHCGLGGLRLPRGLREEALGGAVPGSTPAVPGSAPASGPMWLAARAGLTPGTVLAPGREGTAPSPPAWRGPPPRPGPGPCPVMGFSPPSFLPEGAVATGEDPTSVAIASIQSAATFPDPNIKYVFRTENGGTQVCSPPPAGSPPAGTLRGGGGRGRSGAWPFRSARLAWSWWGGERPGLVLRRAGLGAAVGRCLAARPRSPGALGR